MPGPGPGRTVRRAVAVVLSVSGIVLVVGGVQVCEVFLRSVSEMVLSRPVNCPVTRPPELWWTAAIMQLGALSLWFPPQRASRLWRRPFFRLMTRRRIGSIAGTALMASGVGLMLAAAVGVVLGGQFSESPILGGSSAQLRVDSPPIVRLVAGVAAIWWGAGELKNADRQFQDRLVFLLGAMGAAGVVTTVLGDVIGVGWPGFGLRQLGVAMVFLLAIVGAYALARSNAITRLPLGPTSRLLAGGATVALTCWVALTTKLPTLCYGISCTRDPLVRPRVALSLAALALYLLVARHRRHANLRIAYQDETQFVPIATT